MCVVTPIELPAALSSIAGQYCQKTCLNLKPVFHDSAFDQKHVRKIIAEVVNSLDGFFISFECKPLLLHP